ncbi:MAG: hypothetical protein ABI811_06260 [Acidobacteriota bacterium]
MRTTEFKNRPKHVVFRVSADEYRDLSEACFDAGVRSLSEFVRQAALRFAASRKSNQILLSDDLTTVAMRLEELDGSLRQLHAVIARVLGTPRRSAREESRGLSMAGSPLEPASESGPVLVEPDPLDEHQDRLTQQAVANQRRPL